jgi:hypothetical protein
MGDEYVAKLKIFLGVFIIILLMPTLIMADVTSGTAINNIYKNLTVNDAGTLTAIFNIDKPINITGNIGYIKINTNNVTGSVKGVKIETLQNCTKQNPTYSNNLTCYEYYDNELNQTQKTCYYEVTGWKTEYYECWKNTLQPNGTQIIRITGNIKPSVCKTGYCINTDWIPSINIAGTNYTKTDWAWWNTSYTRCVNITINNTDTNVKNNFPVNLNITYDADMQTDFDDIRFYNGTCNNAGDVIYAELESKTDSANAYVWIRMNLSVGSNNISMYYGNAAVGHNWDTSGNVWDSNYVLVMHMNDSHDSTKNANNAVQSGGTFVDGKWGKAYNVTGTKYSLNISDSTTMNISKNSTFEGWVYSSTIPVTGRVISKELATSALPYALELSGQGNISFCTLNNGTGISEQCSVTTNSAVRIGVWEMVTGTYNVTSSSWKREAFVNGTMNITALNTGATAFLNGTNSVPIRIGNNYALSRYVNGSLDEIRISNTTRSPDWINATYQYIYNNAAFIRFGTENGYVSTNSCSCPSSPAYWMINMSDHCNITSNCNNAGNMINFTGGTSSDYCNITATVNFTNITMNSTGIVWVWRTGILQRTA